eukprot:49884-Chlamydomonas_euryale.AAC.3
MPHLPFADHLPTLCPDCAYRTFSWRTPSVQHTPAIRRANAAISGTRCRHLSRDRGDRLREPCSSRRRLRRTSPSRPPLHPTLRGRRRARRRLGERHPRSTLGSTGSELRSAAAHPCTPMTLLHRSFGRPVVAGAELPAACGSASATAAARGAARASASGRLHCRTRSRIGACSGCSGSSGSSSSKGHRGRARASPAVPRADRKDAAPPPPPLPLPLPPQSGRHRGVATRATGRSASSNSSAGRVGVATSGTSATGGVATPAAASVRTAAAIADTRSHARSSPKALESFLELAVLNERLSGRMSAWEARIKLEHLKRQRRHWAAVLDEVQARGSVASLAEIEAAFAK